MSKVSPEVLPSLAVARWLQEAESALTKAQKTTDDKAIADGCARARREISPQVKRARAVLEHKGGTLQLDIERSNP